MNARIAALALAFVAAPLAASAQAVTAVPPPQLGPGLNLPTPVPPGTTYLLHDAFRAVTRAQAAQPGSAQANDAAALYFAARAKYDAGDRFGAAHEAALARGAAEIGPGVTVPVLQSTIGTSQNVVPRYLTPGLRSLEVKGKPLPQTPIAPSAAPNDPKAANASSNPCDTLPKGPIEAECRKAIGPP
jgi:hypothetical protein